MTHSAKLRTMTVNSATGPAAFGDIEMTGTELETFVATQQLKKPRIVTSLPRKGDKAWLLSVFSQP